MIDKEAENDGEAEGEDLSAADLAAIEAMQRATPDQRANAGEDAPPREGDEPVVEAKPKGEEQAELPLGDEDDDDPDVTIDGQGRTRNKAGEFVESVPKSAYLRVKGKAKADRAEKEALALKNAKAEERLHLLTEIINAQPDPAEDAAATKAAVKSPHDEPDIDETKDPLGALAQERARSKFDREQRKAEMAELSTKLENTEKNGAAARQATAVYEAFKRDAGAFAAKEPAFEQALGHMNGIWHAQLEVMGLTDKDKREQVIAETQRNIINSSFGKQQSPSKAMFDLAVASGFKKAAPPPKDGEQQESDAAKKLNGLNKNMAANKSLSGAGGGALPEDGQRKRISDMTDDEFCDFADTLQGKVALRKIGLMD